jgi:hypothetical protein
MRNLVAWTILFIVFLIAGEGLNLFRIHIEKWLAFGHAVDIYWMITGLIIAFAGTAFLAGFIYHRDQKRGKLKREGWRGRPIKKKKQPRIQ